MEENGGSADPRSSIQIAAGILILLGLAILLGLSIRALIPPRPPQFEDPTFLEAVFDSRFAITCARVLVLAATVYVVFSVIALIRRGQWLVGAGPFKVSESVRAIEREREQADESLNQAIATIIDLERQLEETESELSHARDQLAALREESTT